MSNDTNMWSAGPTASPRASLPPRPDVAHPTSWPSTAAYIAAGSFQTAESWKRIGAVLGIIASFLFFFFSLFLFVFLTERSLIEARFNYRCFIATLFYASVFDR